MVFLHGRRRDGIGRGGVGQALHLTDDASLGVLGNHVAGVDTGVISKESIQPAVARRIQEAVGAALGNGRQVRGDDGEEIKRIGHRRAVEVAVRDHAAILGHHRVVHRGSQLALGHLGCVGQGIAESASYLWGASHGVGILHLILLELLQRGLQDLRAFGHLEDISRSIGLARMRAQLLQVIREDHEGTQQAFHGHGGGNIGGLCGRAQISNGQAELPQHAIGAVNKRESLLLTQLQRLDAGRGQGVACVLELAVDAHLALTQQRQRAVSQRRQIAGAAQRAILAHHRNDASVQRLGIGFYHHGAHAGAASAQGGQAQQHQCADDFFFHFRAGTRSVRTHQGKLQLGAHLLWDMAASKRAKAGGNAVDRGGILR